MKKTKLSRFSKVFCKFTANRLSSVGDLKVSKNLLIDYLNDLKAINSTVFYISGELKIFTVPHHKLIDDLNIKEYIRNKLKG